METFDFITNDGLRQALAADLEELKRCQDAAAYKAVLVISGSIIEALLADSLMAVNFVPQAGKSVLELLLGDLVTAAKANDIISQRAADLCSVIKSYRNLIHPGRLTRLEETVDAESAQIAMSLVSIIAKEISTKRRSTYGLTATQLATKIQSDSSVEGILPHLITDLNIIEQDKLLLYTIPTLYLASASEILYSEETSSDLLQLCQRLSIAFRLAFENASPYLKQKCVAKYVDLVRNSDAWTIAEYGSAFFKASDLQYCEERSLPIMKEHLFTSIPRIVQTGDITFFEGVENHLEIDDIERWVDLTTKAIISSPQYEQRRRQISWLLDGIYFKLNEESQNKTLAQLDDLIDYYRAIGQKSAMQRIQDLRDHLDIPF